MGTVQYIVQYTVQSWWLIVKDKSGDGSPTAVGLDILYNGVGMVSHVEEVTGGEDCYMECEQYGRSGEVVHRRNIDFCCAQETRRKSGSAMTMTMTMTMTKFILKFKTSLRYIRDT